MGRYEVLATAAMTALVWTGPVGAQVVDRQARSWAATCAACHGADSKAAIPAIAGRDAELTYRALIEFKTGLRPAATVMHQHAKGYTDEELKRIAQAVALLPVAK
jgi:cytochrome c553